MSGFKPGSTQPPIDWPALPRRLGPTHGERKAARVASRCDLSVGCEESGVCYAAAHGEPDRCGAGAAPALELAGRLYDAHNAAEIDRAPDYHTPWITVVACHPYTRAQWLAVARAALAALSNTGVPAGWKLVPLNPTADMLVAAADAIMEDEATSKVYAAMLTASPPAP